MKQIIGLINKNFDKNLDFSNYTKVNLFEIEVPNAFQQFLIRDRIQVFQKLFVLDRLCIDEEFFRGCLDLSYYFYDYEGDADEPYGEDKIYVGPCLLLKCFSKEDIFNHLVKGLSIAQIDVPSDIGPFDDSLACVNEVECPPYYNLMVENELFVSSSVILFGDAVWTNDPEQVKKLLSEFDSLFHKFIDEQKEPVGVSHDIYVDWLLRWFPGKVKIRTLSY